VTKAHAHHGYDAVRISVVITSAVAPIFVRRSILDADGSSVNNNEGETLEWDYSGAFKYRWQSQFDTGLQGTREV